MQALFNAWDRAEGKTKFYCIHNFEKIIFNFYKQMIVGGPYRVVQNQQ